MTGATADHAPPRHLEWRIRLFGVGAIVGLIGMWADQRWMVNVAIAVLAVGVVLRFVGRSPRAASPAESDPDDEESDAEEPDVERSGSGPS